MSEKYPKLQNKRMLSAPEAAMFLRQLADQLDDGTVVFDEADMDLSGVVSLKQSMKTKDDKTTMKIKLKVYGLGAHPGDDEDLEAISSDEDEEDGETDHDGSEAIIAESDDKPSYKSLKKRMQKSFKLLGAAAAEGAIADLDEVRDFYKDCLMMTSYSGKGDIYYAQFIAIAERVLSTAEADNIASFQEAMAEMKMLKAECHDRYK